MPVGKNLGKVNMKRKIYDKLLQWKNEKDGTTALMIEGARRIGKSVTTIWLFHVSLILL